MPSNEETNLNFGGFIMKKFLLVLFIGIALVINLYGFVSKFMVKEIEGINHIDATTTTVYME